MLFQPYEFGACVNELGLHEDLVLVICLNECAMAVLNGC